MAGLLGVPGSHDHSRGSSVSNVAAVTAFLLVACPATPTAAVALRNLTRHRRQGTPTSGAYGLINGWTPCIGDNTGYGECYCCDQTTCGGDDDGYGAYEAGDDDGCSYDYEQATSWNLDHSCDYRTQFRVSNATATTFAYCVNISRCTTHQLQPPTMSTDRVCAKPAKPAKTKPSARRLSTSQIVGIVIGCILVIGTVTYVVYTLGRKQVRKSQQQYEESQLQLVETQAKNERLQSAYAIPEADLTWLKRLAEGSFGEVWDGRWGNLRVAIKVLKATLDDELNPEAAADFRQECETLQSIRHPNLLIFYGAGAAESGKAFMVTEFMARGSLRRVLQDPLQSLEWPIRQRMAEEIAKGMLHLHKLSIVHRDLKSDNVLLDEQMGAKVADFGTSKLISARQAVSERINTAALVGGTATMTRGVGTLLWMAPEMIKGWTTYGPAVDVYSYAIIMWELITRKNPWDELPDGSYIEFFSALESALESGRRPEIPVGFISEHEPYTTLMQSCWAKDPVERPSFDRIVARLSGGSSGGSDLTARRTTLNPQLLDTPMRADWRSATVAESSLMIVSDDISGDGAQRGSAQQQRGKAHELMEPLLERQD